MFNTYLQERTGIVMRKRNLSVIAALSGAVLFSASVWASEAADKDHHPEVKQSAEYKPAGDAEAGKVAAAVCAACHGADGNSAAAAFPKIAGQHAKYIVKQLQDMKSGERSVPQMTAFLTNMTDDDMQNLAAYFSSQKIVNGKANPELVELGRDIYRAGVPDAGVAACAACHGATGKGMASAGFPAIGGQHAGYIEAQLKAFRAAGRGDATGPYRKNDGSTMMMRATATGLTDAQIKAVSSYISGMY